METSVLDRKSVIKGAYRPELLRNETLADVFRSSARKFPDKVALVFCNESISYAALDRWSDMIASDLASRGIGRAGKVVVWWRRGIELHAIILGIVKSGAAYVPIDREMPAERVELVLSEVKADACFSRFELNAGCPILSDLPARSSPDHMEVPTGPEPDDYA